MKNKKFWEFKAKGEASGELLLYGDIADAQAWWGNGNEITPKDFKADLDALGDITELNVYINSGGGDVFAGQTIYSILKRHKANVIVTIDGLAASIASIIAMAGDKIVMPCNATIMIHNPMSGVMGNANEMRDMADTLDKIRESMLAVYKAKTGMKEEDLIKLLDAETWMTAEDALKNGFCDEIQEGKQVAASLNNKILSINGVSIDVTKYKNLKIDKFKFVNIEKPAKVEPIILDTEGPIETIAEDAKSKEEIEKLKAKLALECEL